MAILEMSSAIKFIVRQSVLKASKDEEISKDEVIVSLLADLQQSQDEEMDQIMSNLVDLVRAIYLFHLQ